MGFFQTLGTTLQVVLAFFPRWFSTGIISVVVALGVWGLIALVLKLKDLFWPF